MRVTGKEAWGEVHPESRVLLKRDLGRPFRATQYMQTPNFLKPIRVRPGTFTSEMWEVRVVAVKGACLGERGSCHIAPLTGVLWEFWLSGATPAEFFKRGWKLRMLWEDTLIFKTSVHFC